METTNNNIKIVRLKSGEDIIANFEETQDQQKYVLHRPMHVIFKRMMFGRIAMIMLPWLPVELIKKNSAEIYTSDIISILDPKDDLIEYYENISQEAEEMLSGDLNLLGTVDDEEDDDNDEENEIDEEQIQQIMKESKKGTVH